MDWLVRLKTMKQASGLTTKEIADGSGIPEPTLEKLFAGSTKAPKLNTMQQLVHFLGYTLDDLDPEPDHKKNPAPKDSEAGKIDRDVLAEQLYQLFLNAGFVKEGVDLTSEQIDFIDGLLLMMRAFFQQGSEK